MYVVTADQRASRTGDDLVPDALVVITRIGGENLAVTPDRNAGDEVQVATAHAGAALEIILYLLRSQQWSVGLGVGEVETPMPPQIRAARGTAFIRAREAVERAKMAAGRLAVVGSDETEAGDAEALLRLLVELRDRRTVHGWKIADLLAEGLTQTAAAQRLGITDTAVSLRAKAAGLRADEAAIPALERIIGRLR